MTTIVEVEYTNYTENVTVTNEAQQAELLKLAKQNDFVSYNIVQEGDFDVQLTETRIVTLPMSKDDEYLWDMEFEVKDGKVKIIGDICEAYIPRFQKVKETSKGQYILYFGERVYFLNGIDL